ncbi:histidine--tRNA ligase [Breznakiellaceae bacterium SP9]
MAIIEPKVLKGFRDFLPAQEIQKRDLSAKIEDSFRSFGFVPIDTPALEYTQILLGKAGGETEKQVYRFEDNGGRDVALRFDLTVPFARFLAEHRAQLALPFKRYHIAKVWRGENTQKGRYREFTQCDFDIVGSTGAAADFEILLMIAKTLRSIGITAGSIHLNHRGLFNRFLESIGALDHSAAILRTVDKLSKIGREQTAALLEEFLSSEKAAQVLAFIEAGTGPAGTLSFEETLSRLEEAVGGPCPQSIHLRTLHSFMLDAFPHDAGGMRQECLVLDPSITRGLDYYTGVVFETFLSELPAIGSICSGGRYDNLVGLYSKESLSGVGSSIGLDRLIAALESLDKLPQKSTYAQAAIVCVDEQNGGKYQALASRFRERGLRIEVVLDAKALPKQFMAAEKSGIPYCIIPDREPATLKLRDLKKRETIEGLSFEDVYSIIKK